MTSQMAFEISSGGKRLCAENALKGSLTWTGMLTQKVCFELASDHEAFVTFFTLVVLNSIMGFKVIK